MATSHPSPEDLLAEIADLRIRLEEAEDTLRAIREGEVDALVVSGPAGEQIYTLKGADYSYRILIEAISEGAGILALDGDILYANQQLAEILGAPLERLVGTCICDYVEATDRDLLMALLSQGRQGASKGEVSLRNRYGVIVPAYLSFRSFNMDEAPGAVCLVATDLTQQKRQEAILADEQLSRAIFEQAEAVILVVDPEGRIIRSSHEAHQLCHGNLLLRHFDEVFRLAMFDPAAKRSSPAPFRPFSISPILQGRVYHGLEVSFSPPDGREPLDLLLNAGPLLGRQGEVMGAVVALTDITARKKAESEREGLLAKIQVQAEGLRESEERYRSLVELSPDAILVHDGSSYMYANPAAARLFGAATPEELWGKPVLDLLHPLYWDQARERIKKALGGETTELREMQILSLDGRPVDVEVTGVGITYQGKSAVQIVMRDITERKRAEEALKAAHIEAVREKNRLEAVMEALPVGVTILNERGGHVRSNTMFERMWGFRRPLPQEVADYSAYKAWWVDTGKPVQPEEWASARVVQQGEVVLDQFMEIQQFDGTHRFVVNSAAPILNNEGKVTECAVAILDITELQRSKEALKQAHDQLEQKVKDRTAELQLMVAQLKEEVMDRLRTEESLKESEARLIHLSSRLLDAQEAERKRLAAELHDELGHALLTIKLQLGALGRGLTPEQKTLAEDIEALHPFIDGVLDNVRRLYFDLSPGNLEDLGLTGALRQMLDMFAKQHKDIRWQIRLDNLDREFPSPTQAVIYRIVQEILTNIGKHAKPSRVSVRIKRNPTAALFTVEDNGCGFDTSRINSPDDPNRGLGLAAMEERVRMQGGALEIVSRENQGTRIAFTLPLGSGRK
jgi:PAS domain S-box-containing protein